MNRFSFRKLERGDLASLAELHRKYLGAARDDAFYDWKYWRPPAGQHECAIAVDNETGAVAGEIGAIPVAMQFFGVQAPAYFELDVVIDQQIGRMKVFFKLYRMRLDLIAGTQGPAVPLSYTFTIPKTLKITSRFWKIQEIAPAPKLVRVLRHAPFVAEKLGRGFLSRAGGALLDTWSRIRHPLIAPRGLEVREQPGFDASADALWERMKGYYNIWATRTSDYLNWRYAQIPNVRNWIFTAHDKGEMLGYTVVNFQDADKRAGVIQDFQFLKERKDAGRVLLRRVLEFLIESGSAVAIIWNFPHCHTYPLLREFGFASRETTGRSLAGRHSVELKTPLDHVPWEKGLDPREWHLCKGDADDE